MGMLVILPSDHYPFQQNRAVLIDPAGQVVWTYDKTHPTPGPESAFTLPGTGIVPITDTPFGRIASVICFDMDFPRLVRQVGQAHADLLIAPSLDWDTARGSHPQLAGVRAVATVYALVGDGFAYLCVLSLILLAGMAVSRPRAFARPHRAPVASPA